MQLCPEYGTGILGNDSGNYSSVAADAAAKDQINTRTLQKHDG